MIKRIFNSTLLSGKPTESVTAAAFIIAFSGVISRVLGLLRDRILASQFGAGDTLDIYYAAFRIPDLIYNLLILGALSAAFIPIFTGLVAKERKEEAWRVSSGVLTITVLVVSLISILFSIFAPTVMKLITPGFSPEKMATVVSFTRIMFLSPLLLGISAVFGGILVSLKKFLVYSLAPIFYNIGIILGAVLLVKFFGPVGLAWGVALGALLHMAIQYPAVHQSGFRYRPSLKECLKNTDIKKVVTLMIPRTLAVAVTQINLLIITFFASTLNAGSLAIFSLANNIQSVPLGLFGISFAIAVFPVLSAQAAKEDRYDFVKTFSGTFRQILFFVIPVSIFIVVLRAQIVRLILGAGKFDWEDTVLTLSTLGILAVSLFAQSTIPLLARSFYALHDTKTPFLVALVTEAVNILMVIWLIDKYQVAGLAMAFSVASIVNMLLLLFLLHKKFGGLEDRHVAKAIGKIMVAALAAGMAIQISKNLAVLFFELDTFLKVFIQFISAGTIGMAVFFLVSAHLGIEEFFQFRRTINRKLFGVKEPLNEDASEVGGL